MQQEMLRRLSILLKVLRHKAEVALEFRLDAGLLGDFSQRRLREVFVLLNLSAGKAPKTRIISPPPVDEEDFSLVNQHCNYHTQRSPFCLCFGSNQLMIIPSPFDGGEGSMIR